MAGFWYGLGFWLAGLLTLIVTSIPITIANRASEKHNTDDLNRMIENVKNGKPALTPSQAR
jgi:uncharacterized membrane protein YccF (DUF307 family)